MTDSGFKKWRNILIGTFNDVGDLKQSILKSGFKIGSWAEDVLESSNFSLSTHKKEIDLVRITPKDLGFENGGYRKDIYKKATENGLKLCPLEIGPQLRLQYTNQPKLESLQIGMKSQIDSEGHKSQFRIVHGVDNFLWLVGDHKHPEDFWEKDEYFIFIKT